MTDRAGWEERYSEGSTPWDTQVTPPEVHAFWASGRLDPARVAGRFALDLGCGTGTNSAYLAGLGLHVLGFDLSHTALARGQARQVGGSSLGRTLHLIQASVARLPVAGLGAIYVLDVGCLHSLPVEAKCDYAKSIVTNLAPGGYYQLYAFDRDESSPDLQGRSGLGPHEVEALFAASLEIVEICRAQPDPHPCRWFLLHKES